MLPLAGVTRPEPESLAVYVAAALVPRTIGPVGQTMSTVGTVRSTSSGAETSDQPASKPGSTARTRKRQVPSASGVVSRCGRVVGLATTVHVAPLSLLAASS